MLTAIKFVSATGNIEIPDIIVTVDPLTREVTLQRPEKMTVLLNAPTGWNLWHRSYGEPKSKPLAKPASNDVGLRMLMEHHASKYLADPICKMSQYRRFRGVSRMIRAQRIPSYSTFCRTIERLLEEQAEKRSSHGFENLLRRKAAAGVRSF